MLSQQNRACRHVSTPRLLYLRVLDASGRNYAGYDGFEPTTNRLTVYCSTTEPIPHITHTAFNLIPLLRSCFLWSILSVWVCGPRQTRTISTRLFRPHTLLAELSIHSLLRGRDSNPRHSAYETELEPPPVHPAIYFWKKWWIRTTSIYWHVIHFVLLFQGIPSFFIVLEGFEPP